MSDHICYNELPTIDEADERAKQHPDALPALVEVINRHRVQDIFGIRLLHRHFSLKPNEIALFQKMPDVCGHDILVLSPHSRDYQPRQPINFHLREGKLVPYEYTIEPSRAKNPNLADFPEFIQAYEQAIVGQGVENIYGLTILPEDEWRDTQELVAHGHRVTVTVPMSIVDAPDAPEGVPMIDATWKSGPGLGANHPVALSPGCARGVRRHCSGCISGSTPSAGAAGQGEDSSCECSCAGSRDCGCKCEPGKICRCRMGEPCRCLEAVHSSRRLIDDIIIEVLRQLELFTSGEHKS